MALASAVISRVRDLLNDTGSVKHWTDNEMLRWLSDAQRDIVSQIPTANTTIASFTPVASSSEQSLSGISNFHRLLKVMRNTHDTDNRVTLLSTEDELGIISTSWHTAAVNSKATAERYVYDLVSPDVFYVYPNVNTTTRLELKYSTLPIEVSATGDTLELPDEFLPLMTDYMVYRAFAKDTDFGSTTNAKVYLDNYNAGIAARGAS
ncbi:MAG: hypothetical protein HOE77_08125 [Candidatus Marinimicrobia bacterium]|jgi:hypothetical protein|nr:hypothetical protein [Candidatus Neomarinimicrobiota bacterium]